MILNLILLAICTLGVWIYMRMTYFKRKNVPYTPPVPILGNLAGMTLRTEHIDTIVQKGYNKFSDKRYFGLYQFMVPTIIPRDLALIRKILVKDYYAFSDRGLHYSETADPFFGKNIFMLHGTRWRNMRTTLSPAFSTGRMRSMTPMVAKCTDPVNELLKTRIEPEGTELDTDAVIIRYMNDVIISCAFGWLVEPGNDLVFSLSKSLAVDSTSHLLKFFGFENFPVLYNLLGVKIIAKNNAEQFKALFKAALKSRREGTAPQRQDFVQTLLDAAKGKSNFKADNTDDKNNENPPDRFIQDLTDDDLAAQASLFYVAGYDTTSNLASYLLYALARYPEIQERLRNEVKNVDLYGQDLYNDILSLEYLDMCVSETLRLWPLVGSSTRRCVTNYDLGPVSKDDPHSYKITPGVHVWVPIFSLHRDPQYWPEPHKFNPERFHPSNRDKILPFTYLPFGLGPKHCIAPRFAEIAVKVLMVFLLQKYSVSPSKNTPKDDAISPDAFVLRPKEGFFLKVTPLKA